MASPKKLNLYHEKESDESNISRGIWHTNSQKVTDEKATVTSFMKREEG